MPMYYQQDIATSQELISTHNQELEHWNVAAREYSAKVQHYVDCLSTAHGCRLKVIERILALQAKDAVGSTQHGPDASEIQIRIDPAMPQDEIKITSSDGNVTLIKNVASTPEPAKYTATCGALEHRNPGMCADKWCRDHLRCANKPGPMSQFR